MFGDPDTANMISVLVSSEYDMEELKAKGAKKVVINDREGYEAIIQPMPPVKMKLVAFAVADRYYLISCTTSAELFDEYVDMFDNAINSFVIEYPAPVTPTPSPSPSPSPSPTPEEGVPGFGAVFAIAGLLAVAYLLRRKG